MVTIIAVMIVTIPVPLIMPSMSAAIPPSVILVPAAIPFSVQVAAAFVRLFAALSVPAYRPIEPDLSLFDTMLTLSAVVGIRLCTRCRSREQQ